MNNTQMQIILIVSGNWTRTREIQGILEDSHYQVFETNRGELAEKMVGQVKPDLLLIDWETPDVSALAITRNVRANRRYTRLPIILTGREMSGESKVMSLEVGADLCLDGAIFPKEFIARIRALLRRVNG